MPAFSLRIIAWNIAEGRNDNRDLPQNIRLPDIAEQIKNLSPDIVLLNELHNTRGWPFASGVNQAVALANMAGLPYVQWGNTNATGLTGHKAVAILSKYPSVSPVLHKIMRGNSETAYGTLGVTIYINNIRHYVFSTRFDAHVLEDNIAAHQQSIDLIKSLDPNSPVIFCGDFNANSDSSQMQNFERNSGLRHACFERPDAEICGGHGIDHIFYRGPYQVVDRRQRCQWPKEELSDHPWLYVELSTMIGPPDALIVNQQNSHTPIKFFMGMHYGRLLERHWSVPAGDWKWHDHGTPDGTRVATAPGALIIDPQNAMPIKFFVGTQDGRLFERHWSVAVDDWEWHDHGMPDGTGVATAPGALIIDPQTAMPIKFFVGTQDGRLFERHWSVPAGDWKWHDHGTPDGTGVATAPGALIIDPQNAISIKFFLGTLDGRLFERHWDQNSNAWQWADHGRPACTSVATSSGALLTLPFSPINPIRFFLGTADGHLFERYWDQYREMWNWADHGRPPGTAVTTAPGALIIDPQNAIPIKFFVGTQDGRLFERHWDRASKKWRWHDHGTPGTGVGIGPGALIVDAQNTTMPFKFFLGTRDGRLFERHWSVAVDDWEWHDHGTPV